MSETQKIPAQILSLIKAEGFFAAYWAACHYSPSNRIAYESVEKKHYAWFGKNKFKDYSSFKVARNQWIKRQKLNNEKLST